VEKFKRKVFYLGGFDPRGVRFYHQMYREQAIVHERHSGEHIVVSGRRSGGANTAGWTVENEVAGVGTDYEFLRWEDLIGKIWIRNPALLAWRSVATYVAHARFMQFRRMLKLRRGPVITILYPPMLGVLIPLAIALVIGLPLSLLLPGWAAALTGIALGIAASGKPLAKLVVPWLLRFMYFNHRLAAGGPGTALNARIDEFAERIAGQLDDPFDEILLVTHSNGTILGMTLLRRILELRGGRLPANFTLVTLGQVVPVVALRTDAHWYHDDLRALADKDFRLVDISSPPDGAAYYNVDPIALVAQSGKARIDLLSPRFHLFYHTENYNSGWGKKYQAHFDYLRVGDRLSPIDFIGLTASRRTIDQSIAQFRTIP
jgi:hypothetical protein